jgi:hypothetical protein
LSRREEAPCFGYSDEKDRYISCEAVLSKVRFRQGRRRNIEDSGQLGFVRKIDRSLEIISDFVMALKGR